MNISHDCANVHHEERSNAISSAGVPNDGGLVKLRSSDSPVFLVTKMFVPPVAACLRRTFNHHFVPLHSTSLHF